MITYRKTALFGAGLAAGAAIALILANPFSAPDAEATGVCRGNMGDYISSNGEGSRLYVWSLTTNPPQVYAYDYDSGTYMHKDLSLPRVEKKPEQPKPTPAKEINISGVIWTPEPGERTAFINGKAFREGDTFTTKSGKTYKIVEIRQSKEVIYKEVK